jgi:hypothetical protein
LTLRVEIDDRTFLVHLGAAKQEPTRDDLSMAYSPGVARVCRAIAADPDKAFQYTIKRNTVAASPTAPSPGKPSGKLPPPPLSNVRLRKLAHMAGFLNVTVRPTRNTARRCRPGAVPRTLLVATTS